MCKKIMRGAKRERETRQIEFIDPLEQIHFRTIFVNSAYYDDLLPTRVSLDTGTSFGSQRNHIRSL